MFQIIHIIPLKSLICSIRSRLHHLVVENVKDKEPIIYIGDGGTRSIIVWNVFTQEGYRIKLPRFSTTTCIDSPGEDIFYLVLIENSSLNVNYLYFTYLSSTDMFKIKTRDLQKRINHKCIVNIGRKPCKMVIVGSAYGSVIYFRIKGKNNLFSWDTKDNFLEENMMLVNAQRFYKALNDIIIYIYILCSRDFLKDNTTYMSCSTLEIFC